MQDELSLLIQLQTHDTGIEQLSAQADQLALRSAEKNRSLESIKTGVKTAKDKVTTLQLKKKQLELDAENQEKLVKKHQAELNSLKSNDAYKAMMGEIENAKKARN